MEVRIELIKKTFTKPIFNPHLVYIFYVFRLCKTLLRIRVVALFANKMNCLNWYLTWVCLALRADVLKGWLRCCSSSISVVYFAHATDIKTNECVKYTKPAAWAFLIQESLKPGKLEQSVFVCMQKKTKKKINHTSYEKKKNYCMCCVRARRQTTFYAEGKYVAIIAFHSFN